MKKILVSAALVLSLMSVPTFAKGKPAGHGNYKHDEKSDKWKDKEKDHKDKDHKKDWREHDRDREHGRVANNNGRPPGWDKGKKTGWGNCDVPPGQAKKQGCGSTASHQTADHRTASHRTVSTTRYPKDQHRTYPTRRTYPARQNGPTRQTTTTTASTTTTTATANQQKKGGHPFEPVMREKQQAAKTR